MPDSASSTFARFCGVQHIHLRHPPRGYASTSAGRRFNKSGLAYLSASRSVQYSLVFDGDQIYSDIPTVKLTVGHHATRNCGCPERPSFKIDRPFRPASEGHGRFGIHLWYHADTTPSESPNIAEMLEITRDVCRSLQLNGHALAPETFGRSTY